MNFFLKHLITILILISLALPAYAIDKQADAIYQEIIKEYQLNSDGSTSFTSSYKVKLLMYLAVNRKFGESFIEDSMGLLRY